MDLRELCTFLTIPSGVLVIADEVVEQLRNAVGKLVLPSNWPNRNGAILFRNG